MNINVYIFTENLPPGSKIFQLLIWNFQMLFIELPDAQITLISD